MSQAPFVQPKARGLTLHGQLSEGLQHVDLYDCIYRIISSGIQNTEQMDSMEGTYTMDETKILETEQCGSTSVQLVQLPTHSNIPDVSMVRNTGDSEDQYRPMTPGKEEIMRIYEDVIYQAPDLIERTGGLWITGRISP